MSELRISDPQSGTIREAGINFKSKEIWRDNYRGGTIGDSSTIRENTVNDLNNTKLNKIYTKQKLQ